MPNIGEIQNKPPSFDKPDVMMRPKFERPEAPTKFERFAKPDQFKGFGKVAPFKAWGKVEGRSPIAFPKIQRPPGKMMPDSQFGLSKGFENNMIKNYEPPTPKPIEAPVGYIRGDVVPFEMTSRPVAPGPLLAKFRKTSLEDLNEPQDAPTMERLKG